MFNNVALDVVIGLIFIYLLYSLLGTLLEEILATNIGLRSFMLQKAIRRMLDDSKNNTALSDAFYNHPLIKYLADSPWPWPLKNKPAYIKPDTFSKVMIDLLRGQNSNCGANDAASIQNSLSTKKLAWDDKTVICDQTDTYLNSVWSDAKCNPDVFKLNLEQWFNETMDRTTGWYKKYTQILLLGVGLLISVGFNVDTIKIVQLLENNPKLRAQVVQQAGDFEKTHPRLDEEIDITQLKIDSLTKLRKNSDSLATKLAADKQARELNNQLFKQATEVVGTNIKVNNVLAIGWEGSFSKNLKSITFQNIIGWFLTALAISMGAPFWFDLLNKVMLLKGSLSPKKSQQK